MGASADDQGFEEFQQVYPVENDNTEKMAVAGTKEEAEAIYNYLENPNDSNQKEDHNRKGKTSHGTTAAAEEFEFAEDFQTTNQNDAVMRESKNAGKKKHSAKEAAKLKHRKKKMHSIINGYKFRALTATEKKKELAAKSMLRKTRAEEKKNNAQHNKEMKKESNRQKKKYGVMKEGRVKWRKAKRKEHKKALKQKGKPEKKVKKEKKSKMQQKEERESKWKEGRSKWNEG